MSRAKAGKWGQVLRQLTITTVGALGLVGFSEALEYTALVDMNNIDTAFMGLMGAAIGQAVAYLDSNYRLAVWPWEHPMHAIRLNRPIKDEPDLGKDTLELKLTELEENRHLYRDQRYHFVRGELLLEQGCYESALKEFEIGLEEKTSNPWNLVGLVSASAAMNLSEAPDPEHEDLHHAIQWYSAGQVKKSLQCWDDELDRHPDDVEVNILYALALKAMGLSEDANKQWSKTAHIIHDQAMKDGRISEKFYEKGKAYIVRGSKILGNSSFACKLSSEVDEFIVEKQEVDKARDRILNWVKRKNRDKDFDVMEGAAIAPNGMFAFFSRYEQGETLTEFMERDGDLKIMGKSMEYLALVHSLLTDLALPKKDVGRHAKIQIQNLEAKVSEIPEDSPTYRHVPEHTNTLHELITLVDTPAKYLADDDYVYDRDAHGFNDIVTTDGKIVLIDIKTKGLIPRSYDISKRLEIGNFFPNTEEGNIERLDMIDKYLEISENLDQDGADLETREFLKLNADLLGAVSFYIGTLDRQVYNGYREVYVKNAIYSAQRLQEDYFGMTSEEERETYARWEGALTQLLEIKAHQNSV